MQRLYETGIPNQVINDCAKNTAELTGNSFNFKLGPTYDFDYEKLQFESSSDTEWSPIKPENMQIISYILLTSSYLGCILLMIEIVFNKISRKQTFKHNIVTQAPNQLHNNN